jgi:hypothetical protein
MYLILDVHTALFPELPISLYMLLIYKTPEKRPSSGVEMLGILWTEMYPSL